MLQGSEVKSLRAGHVQVADAYAHVKDGEVWLEGVHIAPYQFAHGVGRARSRPGAQAVAAPRRDRSSRPAPRPGAPDARADQSLLQGRTGEGRARNRQGPAEGRQARRRSPSATRNGRSSAPSPGRAQGDHYERSLTGRSGRRPRRRRGRTGWCRRRRRSSMASGVDGVAAVVGGDVGGGRVAASARTVDRCRAERDARHDRLGVSQPSCRRAPCGSVRTSVNEATAHRPSKSPVVCESSGPASVTRYWISGTARAADRPARGPRLRRPPCASRSVQIRVRPSSETAAELRLSPASACRSVGSNQSAWAGALRVEILELARRRPMRVSNTVSAPMLPTCTEPVGRPCRSEVVLAAVGVLDDDPSALGGAGSTRPEMSNQSATGSPSSVPTCWSDTLPEPLSRYVHRHRDARRDAPSPSDTHSVPPSARHAVLIGAVEVLAVGDRLGSARYRPGSTTPSGVVTSNDGASSGSGTQSSGSGGVGRRRESIVGGPLGRRRRARRSRWLGQREVGYRLAVGRRGGGVDGGSVVVDRLVELLRGHEGDVARRAARGDEHDGETGSQRRLTGASLPRAARSRSRQVVDSGSVAAHRGRRAPRR